MLTCVLVMTAASLTATDTADTPSIGELAFLTGSWVADWNGNTLEEHFSIPAGGTMVGMFRWRSGEDTAMTEHIVLEEQDDGVHYLLRHFDPGSTPWADEADGPRDFRLDDLDAGRAVFVNENDTFPARLIYHRTTPDTLTVHLEGRGDDSDRNMTFDFRSTSMTTSTDTLTEAGIALGYQGGVTISFSVKDIAKSIEWYQNVLGFKMLYHLEEMGWCELTSSVEGVNVGLSQVEEVKNGGPTPTFGVKDIEHARSTLEGQGVRFDGPTIEIPGMVKLATFFDPDGNSLMFFQALSDQMP